MRTGKINHYGIIQNITYWFVSDDEIKYIISSGEIFYTHYKSLEVI